MPKYVDVLISCQKYTSIQNLIYDIKFIVSILMQNHIERQGIISTDVDFLTLFLPFTLATIKYSFCMCNHSSLPYT